MRMRRLAMGRPYSGDQVHHAPGDDDHLAERRRVGAVESGDHPLVGEGDRGDRGLVGIGGHHDAGPHLALDLDRHLDLVIDEQRRIGGREGGVGERSGVAEPRPELLGDVRHECTNDHSAEWLQAFRQAVRDMPEIVAAQRMTGDLDYVLRVRLADVPAYDRFYQRLIKKVKIADVSASFVMEDIKETTALPL